MPVRESERIRGNQCGGCKERQSIKKLKLWIKSEEEQLRICESCWDCMNTVTSWSSLPSAAKPSPSMPEVRSLQKPRRTRKTADSDASGAAARALAAGGSMDTAVHIDSSDEDNESLAMIDGMAFPSLNGIAVTGQKCYSRQRMVREGLRDTTLRRLQNMRFAYPPRFNEEQVEVHGVDLRHLAPFEFLNDTIIDFYIKYMQRPEFLEEIKRSTMHFCNSFFFKKLLSIFEKKNGVIDQAAALEKLRKWTNGADIFEKSYMFVPIHDRLHWSLAIICFPGAVGADGDSGENEPCLLHLDSLSRGHYSPKVFRILRSYLAAEWESKCQQEQTKISSGGNSTGGDSSIISASFPPFDIKVKRVLVPQQENEFDCGCFLLYYLQSFIQTAPATFRLEDIEKKGLFGRYWFTPENASSLRGEIRQLVEKLLESGKRDPAPRTSVTRALGRKRSLTNQVQGAESQQRKNHEICEVRSGANIAGVGELDKLSRRESTDCVSSGDPTGHGVASRCAESIGSQSGVKRRREELVKLTRKLVPFPRGLAEGRVEGLPADSSAPQSLGHDMHWWTQCASTMHRAIPQVRREGDIVDAEATVAPMGNGEGREQWSKVDSNRWAATGEEANMQKEGQEARGSTGVGEAEEALSEEMGSLYGGGMQGNHLNGLQSLEDELGDDRGWWEETIGVDKNGGKLEADAAEGDQRPLTDEDGEAYMMLCQNGPSISLVDRNKGASRDLSNGSAGRPLSGVSRSQRASDTNGSGAWRDDLEPWSAGGNLAVGEAELTAGVGVLPLANELADLAGPTTSTSNLAHSEGSLRTSMGMHPLGFEVEEGGCQPLPVCGGPAGWEGYQQREASIGMESWWHSQTSGAPKWFAPGASAIASGERMTTRRQEILGTFVPVMAPLSSSWGVPLGPQGELRLDGWEAADRERALQGCHAELPGEHMESSVGDDYPTETHLPAVAEEEAYFGDDAIEKDELKLVMEILEDEEEALGLEATPIGCGMSRWDNLDCEDPFNSEKGTFTGSLTGGRPGEWIPGSTRANEEAAVQANFGRGLTSQAGRFHATPFAQPVGRNGAWRHSGSCPPERLSGERVRRVGKKKLSRARSAGAKLVSRCERRPQTLPRAKSESSKDVTPTRRSHRLSIKRSGGRLLLSSRSQEPPALLEDRPQIPAATSSGHQQMLADGLGQIEQPARVQPFNVVEATLGEHMARYSSTMAQHQGGLDADTLCGAEARVAAQAVPVVPETDGIKDSGKCEEDVKHGEGVLDSASYAAVAASGSETSRELHRVKKAALDSVHMPVDGSLFSVEQLDLGHRQEQGLKGDLPQSTQPNLEVPGEVQNHLVETAVQAMKEDDGEDPWSLDLEESARTRGMTAWEGASRGELGGGAATGGKAEDAKKAASLRGESRLRGPSFASGWGGRLPIKKPTPAREPTSEKRDTGVTVTFVYPSREDSESEVDRRGADGNLGVASRDTTLDQAELGFSSDVLDQCVCLAAQEMVGVGESGVRSRGRSGEPKIDSNGLGQAGVDESDTRGTGLEGRCSSLRGEKLTEDPHHHSKGTMDSSPVLAVKLSSRNRRPPRRLVEDGVDSLAYIPSSSFRKTVRQEQNPSEVSCSHQPALPSSSASLQCVAASQRGQSSNLSPSPGHVEECRNGIRDLQQDSAKAIVEQPVMRVYERRSSNKALEARVAMQKEGTSEQAPPQVASGMVSGPNPVSNMDAVKDITPVVPKDVQGTDPSGRASQSRREISLASSVVGNSPLDCSPAMTVRSGARERKRPQRFSDDELESWWVPALIGSERKGAGSKSNGERKQSLSDAADSGGKPSKGGSTFRSSASHSVEPAVSLESLEENAICTEQVPAVELGEVALALPSGHEKQKGDVKLDSLDIVTSGQLPPTSDDRQTNGKKPKREARRGGSGTGPEVEGALGMLKADLGQPVEVGEMPHSNYTGEVKHGGMGLRLRKLRTLEDDREP